MLFKIFDLVSQLKTIKSVFVTTPYNSRVRYLEDYLNKAGNFLSDSELNSESASFYTVDSFRGRERSAVIISMTISNRHDDFGVLTEARRINVATSRAEHLLLLIGDFGALYKSRMMAFLFSAANHGSPGSLMKDASHFLLQ